MSLEVISVIVPILCTIIFGLIAYANKEAMGRITDKLIVVDQKINHHIDKCHGEEGVNVIESRLVAAEGEIVRFRGFAHWVRNVLTVVMVKLDIKVSEHKE